MKVLWDGTYGFSSLSHPRRPKGSQSGRGKRRDESSKAKAPGYRPSPDHFKTVKRMLASHWAQKMLVLLSLVGEQHRLSVPECVRTRLLLSRHSVLYLSGSFKVVRARETFIFYFTNEKRNYRWLGKTFGRTIPICTSFLFSRPAPFSRTLHFLVFPTLSHLPHYLRAWNRLKSLKCWWGRTRYACNFQDMYSFAIS